MSIDDTSSNSIEDTSNGGLSILAAPQEARLAKSVPSAVQVAMIKVCEATPTIDACLLFDIRERGDPGAPINLLVELVLDDGAELEATAAQFASLIAATPSLSGRTYFAATGQFGGLMRQALYRRS